MKATIQPGSAIHRAKILEFTPFTGFTKRSERREVTVLAVAGEWSMVQRKGAMPYCCPTKQLKQKPSPTESPAPVV